MRDSLGAAHTSIRATEIDMYRLPLLLASINLLSSPLIAQVSSSNDSLAFSPVGRYRLDILSPLPRGEWSGLVTISLVDGRYQGTFGNPDGPETYPVKSVEARRDSLFITMAGPATGSIFSLEVKGDSVAGTMTSLVNGLTQVKGTRLKQ